MVKCKKTVGINDRIYRATGKTSWVSGTQIANYLLRDPVIDWLNLYYSKHGLNNKRNLRSGGKVVIKTVPRNSTPSSTSTLMRNGLSFETKIYEDLCAKFGPNVVNLNGERDISLVLGEIEKQTPIILQAYVKSDRLKLHGVTDILIRSDWLDRIGGKVIDTTPYYVVVDIKWSHMTLCVDGKTIRNEGRFKAYKGQLLIYNTILGELQNYTPPCAYIMPKSWNIDKKGWEREGYSCYDVLGVVDFENRDSQYVDDTIKAINWVRDVRENGSGWSPLHPHIPEMCCNASNTNDEPWGEIKKRIMDETRDITRVWMVAPEHRNRAFKKRVKRWDDKRCNTDMLGFTGDKSPRRKTIQEILNINQQDREIIRPRTIQDNRCRWQTRYPTDFYIDYETINESYIKLEDRINIHNSKLLRGYIFMIGVGYEVDGEWKFKSFTCRDYTLDEEKRIVGEFQDFVKEEKKRVDPQDEYPIRFFHWAHVEKTLLESFFQRSNTVWRDYCEIRWVDMCSIFTSNPIVVKGALTFKLKDIAKALYKAGLIQSSWTDDKMSDGMMAMTTAIDYYFGDRNRDIMDSIQRYNMIDCKVIWEIVACLRKQTSI